MELGSGQVCFKTTTWLQRVDGIDCNILAKPIGLAGLCGPWPFQVGSEGTNGMKKHCAFLGSTLCAAHVQADMVDNWSWMGSISPGVVAQCLAYGEGEGWRNS